MVTLATTRSRPGSRRSDMTLIEELRADELPSDRQRVREARIELSTLRERAARRIEKLELALKEIIEFDTYEDISNEECMRDIARAAVEDE